MGGALEADIFVDRWREETMTVPINVEATPGGVTVVPAALQDTLTLPRRGADSAVPSFGRVHQCRARIIGMMRTCEASASHSRCRDAVPTGLEKVADRTAGQDPTAPRAVPLLCAGLAIAGIRGSILLGVGALSVVGAT